jgi:hypothetical protein
MNPTLDLSGSEELARQFQHLGQLLADATPLMLSWMKLVDDGNRRGILAGKDDRGEAMVPVKYRPRGTPIRPAGGRGAFQGFGSHRSGLHGNLSRAEYERLAGPPLAPRGMGSRVITNFQTDYANLRAGLWQVTWWWEDVVSVRGVPFLRYHFLGEGRLPRRDLRAIRPEDRIKVDRAQSAWTKDIIRQA